MIQNRLAKQPFTLHNPPHSEVNEDILNLCASSPIVRSSLEEALERNSNGTFRPVIFGTNTIQAYRSGKPFSTAHLSSSSISLTSFHCIRPRGKDSRKFLSTWQSFLLYHGGLTFDSHNPTKHIRIPNFIAARRIATAVLNRYGLGAKDIDRAIDIFVATGDITESLKLYQYLRSKGDVHHGDFDNTDVKIRAL